jgi:hypothetical protein
MLDGALASGVNLGRKINSRKKTRCPMEDQAMGVERF